jgi:hypothetical protein
MLWFPSLRVLYSHSAFVLHCDICAIFTHLFGHVLHIPHIAYAIFTFLFDQTRALASSDPFPRPEVEQPLRTLINLSDFSLSQLFPKEPSAAVLARLRLSQVLRGEEVLSTMR